MWRRERRKEKRKKSEKKEKMGSIEIASIRYRRCEIGTAIVLSAPHDISS